ncbi:MAG: LytTR family transcriptional regulator DNA-binding domain-containing protein [Melioribacteraceae bacterium]|nr:LytTR family transcriptional regulator DNA-binding domain-containing protein [Melioribacteraceae bacterium]
MSEKIRTIIIDDESLARDIIKNYLKKYEQIVLIEECSNGFDGVKAINELKPDLVFLDIQMPKLTGFEMLELIDHYPAIIFTTAFDQFAIKAFEVNATDYLLKPFSEERFAEALSRIKNKLDREPGSQKQIEELSNFKEKPDEYLERIAVKSAQKISVVQCQKIKFFEAQDDFVMIYTDDSKYLKKQTLKYFEENLDPAQFIRIHRSYIINSLFIKQIELFEKESYKLILTDGSKLPISKTGYQKLKELLS